MQPVRWQCNRVRAEYKTLASADAWTFERAEWDMLWQKREGIQTESS
jgi:hypothetical protein